ncbi:MAG TPA: FAD-dependent oxidoreductase [Gemmatimonadales bacterium]|jgi:Protoporphyrinogen oxidase
MTRHRKPVAILGAGIAGVTAAAALRRRGVPVRLYEAGRQIAGMAASYKDAKGFSNDFGAHFITNRLAAAIGVGAACRDVGHYGEAVLLRGRSYGYPFGLLRNPRMALSGLRSKLKGGRAVPTSAAHYFRTHYGSALADRIAIPLIEAWSGAKAESLASAAVSEKLQNGTLRSIQLALAGRMTGRAVANGYSHEMPEHMNVWHVYPEGGVSILVQRLAQGLEDVIRLESPVQGIVVEDGRVVAVQVADRLEECSAAVSTAPCNVLPKLLRGWDGLSHLTNFRFRPMVFVNLRLRGRGLLPDTVLWTPESEFPFFRLTETTISMPWLAPPGKSVLTVDFGCEKSEPVWSMTDEALTEHCLDHLTPIIRDVRLRYLGVQILRTPIAYPVYLNEYEESRQLFRDSTGVKGLYSIGRNGEFAHILMEDVYWRTLAKVRRITQEFEAAA